MDVDRAVEIAKLWRAGKMIGADTTEVTDALLLKIEQLQRNTPGPTLSNEKIASNVRSLAFFWEEYEDIERWVGFNREEVAGYAPDVLSAWDALKQAEVNMECALKSACDRWPA